MLKTWHKAAWEVAGIALLLPCLWVWLSWVNSYPRQEALQRAPAWDPAQPCEVMSVLPWRRGQRYARCWPLGLPRDRPITFAGLHAIMAGAVVLVVVGGRRRRGHSRGSHLDAP